MPSSSTPQPKPPEPDRSPPTPPADNAPPSKLDRKRRPADSGVRDTLPDDEVDEAGRESFPASDPPGYTGATAG